MEIILPSFATPNPPCILCGGKLEREVSGASARFVGTGFFATDYSGASPRPSPGVRPMATGAVSAKGGTLRAPSRPRRTNGFVDRRER